MNLAMAKKRVRNFLELSQRVPGARAIGGEELEVSGLAYDSRKVNRGDLFVAVPGFEVDGHDYAPAAVSAGASAIVIERAVNGVRPDMPSMVVPSCREAMALLADAFHGHPSGDLSLIGVTGTNGKTTTAFLVDAILRRSGLTTGLMGTIHYRVGERVIEAPRTTSEAPDVQAYMREMLEAGATHVVMEVSSHALDLHRVLGCDFSVAVFTNLTQDHLDFHGDMESYFQAKLKFFTKMEPKASVVNFDDPYGKRIAEILKKEGAKGEIWTYGLRGGARVQADNLSISAEGMSFDFLYSEGAIHLETSLTGQHNASNILAASATCLALGLSLEQIAEGVKALEGVPGRFEKVDLGQPFLVVVDYAHTDDALASVLRFARPVTKGRILTLMGCGGDRDRTKRPRMAAAALRESDRVFMTSDNPRTEDPAAILKEVEAGADLVKGGRERSCTIVDRREAIRAIIAEARAGDTVVLAGKGHEDYQVIGTEKIHFDDREEAREALQALGYGR